MNIEEKRIKIAEACGRCTCKTYDKPGDFMTAVCHGCGNNPFFVDHELPNYFNDLNACHQMEDVLDQTQWETYIEHLRTFILKGHTVRGSHGATASQRAEAFGLTLGLWKEGE